MYLILFLGSNSLTIPVCQTFQSHKGLENLADKKKKIICPHFGLKKGLCTIIMTSTYSCFISKYNTVVIGNENPPKY